MAEEKEKQEPEAGAPKDDLGADLAGLGGEDDLMDLFSEEDTINEELALLTADLPDVQMSDVLAQVRDVQSILNRR